MRCPIGFRRVRAMVFVSVLATLMAGCAAEPRVVANYHDWLKDGQAVSWKLDAGRYKLDVTASGDGVAIDWEGSSCPKSGETRAYSVVCDVPATGQVVVTNPTSFGLGAASSVTVKITRQGDAQ